MRTYTPPETCYQETRPTRETRKGVLMVRTKTIKSGDYLESEIYPVVDGEWERGTRKGKTLEQMQKHNFRRAQKRLERLLNCNFGPGDLLPHLTCAKPLTEEEMLRVARNFIRRLKRAMRKAGSELRYLYVIESTGEGANRKWHIHMAMNGGALSRDQVEAIWGQGLARVDRVQKQEKGLCGFAQYITMRKETQARLLRRRWACSKGLKQPRETVSQSKFTRGATRKIETWVRNSDMASLRAHYAKKYPGYELTEEPRIRYSDFLPGVYVYAFLRRSEA